MNLASVQQITQRFDAAGITYATGGSGLLYALGLTERVRDWDLTTDAPFEAVAQALQDIDFISLPSGDYPFASSYRLSVEDNDLPVDIIGRYAIHSESGICQLATWVTSTWQSLNIGSPEIWAAAYTLMKRDSKAELLFSYITEKGANREIVQSLLEEPLPSTLRSRLQSLL